MQRDDVAINSRQKERRSEGFAQEKPGDHCRDDDANHHHKAQVVFVLEHNKWVGFQVAHIHFVTERFNVRMFFTQKPSHVREEKSATAIMRVGVCINKLVMHAEWMK